MPQFDDDIALGPAVGPRTDVLNPSPMTRGVGPLGRIYIWDVVPLAANAANIAALQTTAGAGQLVLTAGAGVSRQANNVDTRFILDTPRCLTLTSAANLSAVNFIISGVDLYGQRMTQIIAGPNANTVTTLKAFMAVFAITTSAAVGTAVSVGTSDVLGFPVFMPDANYIVQKNFNGAADTGAITGGVTTSPATGATGDVRGKYTLTSASDGVKRLVVVIAMRGLAVGPNATRAGAFGVDNA